MMRTLVLLGLVAWRFGEAGKPCTTVIPPQARELGLSANTVTVTPAPTTTGPTTTAGPTTTGPTTTAAPVAGTTTGCGRLCKGLVGTAAGLAGLGAIGGIVAATMGTDKPTVQPPVPTPGPPPSTPGPTVAPTVAPTTVTRTVRPDVPAGGSSPSSDSSGSWLWPLLLGLLALCCLGALLGFLCMGKPKKAKRTTKVKKTSSAAPVVAPQPEAAPLVSGHYEQPMMTVPVATTATPSYTMPTVMETVVPTMYETVAPIATTSAAYMPMAAQSYMPMAYETVAPIATTAAYMPTAAQSYMPMASMAAPTYAMTPTMAAPIYGTSQYGTSQIV